MDPKFGLLLISISMMMLISTQPGACFFDGIFREMARQRAMQLLQLYPDLLNDISKNNQQPFGQQTPGYLNNNNQNLPFGNYQYGTNLMNGQQNGSQQTSNGLLQQFNDNNIKYASNGVVAKGQEIELNYSANATSSEAE